jgi:hypothetical protein
VGRALAALELALRKSVAIRKDRLKDLHIRLLPARYMFYIQVHNVLPVRSAAWPVR